MTYQRRFNLFYIVIAAVVVVTLTGLVQFWRDISRIAAALPVESLHRERDFSALLLDVSNLEWALRLSGAQTDPAALDRLIFQLDLAIVRQRDNRDLYDGAGIDGADLSDFHRRLEGELQEVDDHLRQHPANAATLLQQADRIGVLRAEIKTLSDRNFQASMEQASVQRLYLLEHRRLALLILVLFGGFGLGLVVLLLRQSRNIARLNRQDGELRKAAEAAEQARQMEHQALSRLEVQSAELQRSNGDLEQFAYVVSHDLRAPLRMVASYSQLLQRKLSPEGEARDWLKFVLDGAIRMDSMLVSLLEYSRVGRSGEPMALVESRAAVAEALQFLGPMSAETRAEICTAGDWPLVQASPNELTRLFQNLIANALKFCPSDRVPSVTIAAQPQGRACLFRVSDNGIGIRPEDIDRLFKVFQRLHPAQTYAGSGIGLAVCRRIVERHGGQIWVDSPGEGQGSCFCFTLPLPAAEADGPTGTA